MLYDIQQKISRGERLSEEEISAIVIHEIPIDKRRHCFQERQKRERLRFIAINQLRKKYGYK
jgi:hypothetical protein